MKIRKARKEDARKISLLKRETLRQMNSKDYSKELFEIMLEKNNEKNILRKINERDMFCLLEGNKIIGVVNLSGNMVRGLSIRYNFIGKGNGLRLMKFVESFAKKKKLKKLLLYPTKSSIKFYKKIGYETISKENLIIGNCKIKVPLMEKKLK